MNTLAKDAAQTLSKAPTDKRYHASNNAICYSFSNEAKTSE